MKTTMFLVLALCLALAAACTPLPPASIGQSGGVAVTDVWARAAATGNSAAFMILRNGSGVADRLVKAESDVANAVEIHKTTMEGDVMRMAPVDPEGVEIPAQGQAELKPGGFHVMFIGLKRELKAGDKIKIKLQFEKAGAKEVEAEVRNP